MNNICCYITKCLCEGNVEVWGARHFVQHDELSEDPLSPWGVLVSCPQRSPTVPGLHSGKDAHSVVCVSQQKCSAVFQLHFSHVFLCSSLWSMLKSEFCQLASLAVPQLLHALSLSHGADIFWNLINSNFNNKDWKIRFEAGPRQTQISHLRSPLNLIQSRMQC